MNSSSPCLSWYELQLDKVPWLYSQERLHSCEYEHTRDEKKGKFG